MWDKLIESCFGVPEKQSSGNYCVPGPENLMSVIQKLSKHYRLGIMIKPDSVDSALVASYLEQQEVSGYFDLYITDTSCSNGSGALVDDLKANESRGCLPSDIWCVSGSFPDGIVDANQAGFKTVWINPTGAIAPGLIPIQNVEVMDLQSLPGALVERGALPDIQTCRAWYQKEDFSALLWMHVQMVAFTAYQLAVWLRLAGERVDPLLTHRGALLHDLAKLSARQPSHRSSQTSHGELAAIRLEGYGQSTLAEIARRHMLFCVLDYEAIPETWEQVLVYFADKLVEGAAITGYEVRLAALQVRYPGIDDRLEQTRTHIENMQSNIGQILGFSTGELITQLQDAVRR
jgi:hypothetical protein